MNPKPINKILLGLIIIGIVAISAYLLRSKESDIINSTEPTNQTQTLPVIELNEMFYEEENFALASISAEQVQARSDIYAIIVPHHLVASTYQTQLVKMSSGREISSVVIIGPNHDNIGTNPIASVRAKWQTPFGDLSTDPELTNRFLFDFQLAPDKEAFKLEHSIGSIVPVVKYYLPQAKILPIILSSNADAIEASQIGEWLVENLPEDSLIIISIDFSHYLTKEEADARDQITQELILNRDIEKILRLSNVDNVDSPVSLATVLHYANEKKLKTEIIHHSNSFDFAIEKPQETTSYFAITFSK